MQLIAEGVETRAIWDKLHELGCQIAQGYYLSRPIPADTLTAVRSRSHSVAPATAAGTG